MNSYDPNLASTRDKVRFLLGDTQEPWALSNPEIDAILNQHSDSVYTAAISLCRRLIAKYSRLASSASVGPFSISYGELRDSYKGLLATLEQDRQENGGAISPYVSGYDPAAKEADRTSGQVEPTHARIGIHGIDMDIDYTTGDYFR